MLFQTVFAIFAAAAASVSAAPVLNVRQIGGIECNINRVQIVAGLASTKKAVAALQASPAMAANADTLTTVQDGIQGAQTAIGAIGKALITGTAAPAEDRDAVQTNLTSAQDALSTIAVGSVDPNDKATLKLLSDAQSKLSDSITAGLNVVNNCK